MKIRDEKIIDADPAQNCSEHLVEIDLAHRCGAPACNLVVYRAHEREDETVEKTCRQEDEK